MHLRGEEGAGLGCPEPPLGFNWGVPQTGPLTAPSLATREEIEKKTGRRWLEILTRKYRLGLGCHEPPRVFNWGVPQTGPPSLATTEEAENSAWLEEKLVGNPAPKIPSPRFPPKKRREILAVFCRTF